MKLYFLFIVFLVVLHTIYAKSIENVDEKVGGVKSKRDFETSTECKYINSIFNKDESYYCCNGKSIVCKEGHIVEL